MIKGRLNSIKQWLNDSDKKQEQKTIEAVKKDPMKFLCFAIVSTIILILCGLVFLFFIEYFYLAVLFCIMMIGLAVYSFIYQLRIYRKVMHKQHLG